jgi:hypothetical protein
MRGLFANAEPPTYRILVHQNLAHPVFAPLTSPRDHWQFKIYGFYVHVKQSLYMPWRRLGTEAV